MRLPDFIIAGTQKGGTTWLEHNLNLHHQVSTPKKQLHYFDKNYEKGIEWYSSWFKGVDASVLCGEKTTEYFDTETVEKVFNRMSQDCPNVKVFVILRDPVKRAISAVQHMVNSGLEKMPSNIDRLLFDDQCREPGKGFRYIERGFYAQQLNTIYQYIPKEQVCVLIFERDIVSDPECGWQKVCEFLEVDSVPMENLKQNINTLRLSKLGILASYFLYKVPYARGVIRRLDRFLNLSPWSAGFLDSTVLKLQKIYEPENERLFKMLGYRIPEWVTE